jgi:hypothetical protein
MKIIAWLTSNIVALALLGIIALLILMNVRSCSDKDQSRDAAVMSERLRLDSIRATNDSIALAETRQQLNLALANGVRVIDRWHEAAPRPIKTGTPHDSITQLAKQVKECRDVGDTLVQSVVKIRSTCLAYRDTATKTIRNLNTRYAHLDSLYNIGKPPKRFGVGPYVGYGFHTDSALRVRRGWSAGVAVHYDLFQF